MYAHRAAWSVASVVAFAATLLAVEARGARGWVVAASQTTRVVASPAEAALVWEETKVKGRTLLLFDAYPHDLAVDTSSDEQPPPSDLVRYGIFRGIVRRLYLVVPDADWLKIERNEAVYRPLRRVRGAPEAEYLFTFSGVPMIAVTPSSLPTLREQVLVYANEAVFDRSRVGELLARKGLSSDLLIAYRPGGGR